MDAAAKDLLNSHMAVAYAISYLFGTIGLIVFVGSVAPILLGIDVRSSARELEKELGIAHEEDVITVPCTRIVVRAHQVAANGPAAGKSAAEIEALHEDLSVERVVREDGVHEREWIGPEIDQPLSLSFPTCQADIVLTSNDFAGKTIREAKDRLSSSERRGCFVTGITRQGLHAVVAQHLLRRGNLLSLTGRTASVENIASRVGRIRESNYQTDIAIDTLGWALGSLLGLVSTHIGMIPVELGVGEGC